MFCWAMVVEGAQARRIFEVVMGKQFSCSSCVFGEDEVGVGEDIERAQVMSRKLPIGVATT